MALPGYVALHERGELRRRGERLLARLERCDLCPRRCGVDRRERVGACGVGRRARVSKVVRHHGEEPAISGTRGSGTVFFTGCNLHCLYCQNHQISQHPDEGREMDADALAGALLALQESGAHNVNFVSPTHVTAQVVEALDRAAGGGLRLPVVWNSNGYESADVLRELAGVVQVFLPDLKYAGARVGAELSAVSDYPRVARAALREMARQVGGLATDAEGVATQGLIVRHLVLPHNASGTPSNLRFVANELGEGVALSLMSQYAPAWRAHGHRLVGGRVDPGAYRAAAELVEDLGISEGWVQDPVASPEHYRPDFREDAPFEAAECNLLTDEDEAS